MIGLPVTNNQVSSFYATEEDINKRTDEPYLKLIQRKIMNEEGDKLRDRQRVKEKKMKLKMKTRALRAEKLGGGIVAELGTPDEDEEYSDEEGDYQDEGEGEGEGEEYEEEEGDY